MKSVIGTVKGIRRCSIYPCKGIANNFIGDSDHQHLRNNLFLCDEHLEQLYDEVKKYYNIQDTKDTVDTVDTKDTQDIYYNVRSYIKLQFQNSGVTSKVKLIDFCKENNIELPDDVNMKGILKTMFPGIVGDDNV